MSVWDNSETAQTALRTQAAGGDLIAVSTLLHHAVAEGAALALTVAEVDQRLTVQLIGTVEDLGTGLWQLRSEVGQWPPMPWEAVDVQGHRAETAPPLWQQAIELKPQGAKPTVQERPPSPEPQPGRRAKGSEKSERAAVNKSAAAELGQSQSPFPEARTQYPMAQNLVRQNLGRSHPHPHPHPPAHQSPQPPDENLYFPDGPDPEASWPNSSHPLAWRNLIGGFAVVIIGWSFLGMLLSPFQIMVHELGHAAIAWAFGYPAIPSLDFIHGGGVTAQFPRSWLILGALSLGVAYIYHRYRRNPLALRCLLVFLLMYGVMAFTRLHDDLIVAMGHGLELGMGCLFLFRAVTASNCRTQAEPPIYGFLGAGLWWGTVMYAQGLAFDAQVRARYVDPRGITPDWVILARHYTDGSVATVAQVFLLGCVGMLALVVWASLHREQWQPWCDRILSPDPNRRSRINVR
jgi:hypothetical protein